VVTALGRVFPRVLPVGHGVVRESMPGGKEVGSAGKASPAGSLKEACYCPNSERRSRGLVTPGVSQGVGFGDGNRSHPEALSAQAGVQLAAGCPFSISRTVAGTIRVADRYQSPRCSRRCRTCLSGTGSTRGGWADLLCPHCRQEQMEVKGANWAGRCRPVKHHHWEDSPTSATADATRADSTVVDRTDGTLPRS